MESTGILVSTSQPADNVHLPRQFAILQSGSYRADPYPVARANPKAKNGHLSNPFLRHFPSPVPLRTEICFGLRLPCRCSASRARENQIATERRKYHRRVAGLAVQTSPGPVTSIVTGQSSASHF